MTRTIWAYSIRSPRTLESHLFLLTNWHMIQFKSTQSRKQKKIIIYSTHFSWQCKILSKSLSYHHRTVQLQRPVICQNPATTLRKSWSTCQRLTRYTIIWNVQVCFELARTVVGLVQAGIRYPQLTVSASRALAVEMDHDVSLTTDITVIGTHTPTQHHASVTRLCDYHNLAVRTLRPKRLCFAELTRIC